ncbi:LamG-like jellyroll fold domain-containing protein [Serratia sp. DD3]|uniref:LamG-like jellyroll fold domain-containing protein n=1 Tax=Serratia sp. DD3 TaxID=1410619 RepID=UPI0003C4E82F|nr:LamG-like jellyroll fold domain-containing protein [Serratia sp. DD3]KEY59649.1 sulfatase [Serratia sp. DD3]
MIKNLLGISKVVFLATMLTACNGDSTSQDQGTGTGTDKGTVTPPLPESTDDSRHVLLITVDGLDAAQLQQAITAGTMPSLSSLSFTPAYTGGIVGTATQQDLLSGPGLSTIFTGNWANRHQVTSDTTAQVIQGKTLFTRLKTADAAHHSVVIASNPLLPDLLQDEQNKGAIDHMIDCAGVDLCVAQAASLLIQDEQYDTVVANFHNLSSVSNSGLYSDYQQGLKTLNQQLDSLFNAVKSQQAKAPLQKWLIIVTSDRGLRSKGALPALPSANQTVFIAMNQPGNALFKRSTVSSIYDYASQTDVTPTILDFMEVKEEDLAQWDMDGQSLLSLPAVQQLQATVDGKEINLNWRLAADSTIPAGITVYRNGQLIDSLPGTATTYHDSAPGIGLEGEKNYTFNYVVAADYSIAAADTPISTPDNSSTTHSVPTAVLASVDYQAPNNELAPKLLDGLLAFLPFDNGLVDIKGGSGLARLNATDTPISFTSDNFSGQALVIDPKVNSYTMPAPLASLPQFTIGFWYNSDAKQAWLPMVTNKDWDSGKNSGFIISQTSGANGVTMNFGDGSQRADTNLYLPSNQWVYIALTVDVTAQKAIAYVAQPGQKLQISPLDLSSLNLAKTFSNETLVFNEDATGVFYRGYAIGSVSPKYNDFALWGRVLSANEVTMLFSSGQSLTTLNP